MIVFLCGKIYRKLLLWLPLILWAFIPGVTGVLKLRLRDNKSWQYISILLSIFVIFNNSILLIVQTRPLISSLSPRFFGTVPSGFITTVKFMSYNHLRFSGKFNVLTSHFHFICSINDLNRKVYYVACFFLLFYSIIIIIISNKISCSISVD